MIYKFKTINEIPDKFTGECYADWIEQHRSYKNGRYHNLDGPAIIHYAFQSYYIDGIGYDEDVFKKQPMVLYRRMLKIIEYKT